MLFPAIPVYMWNYRVGLSPHISCPHPCSHSPSLLVSHHAFTPSLLPPPSSSPPPHPPCDRLKRLPSPGHFTPSRGRPQSVLYFVVSLPLPLPRPPATPCPCGSGPSQVLPPLYPPFPLRFALLTSVLHPLPPPSHPPHSDPSLRSTAAQSVTQSRGQSSQSLTHSLTHSAQARQCLLSSSSSGFVCFTGNPPFPFPFC